MRVSEVGQAFRDLTQQFNIERFSGIASALALARVATADAIAWAQERTTFGKRLAEHQSLKHRLVSMVREIHAAYGYLDQCVWRFENGEMPVADLCMLKIHATGVLEKCAQGAMHVLAGEAYRGNRRVQRIYREAQIFTVGGGTEEILNDLAARQMKF
jgi:acyl-CoA dehydrogenase